MVVRGSITTRTSNNKSQTREKTPQDVSRDLEKVQRIIEIDQDIMKSQIKNLNSEYKNKKQSLELENRVLGERVRKLEAVVIEEKKEVMRVKDVFERMVLFFKGKFEEQAEINSIYGKEIHELKGSMRMMSINSRASGALERSSSRGHSPFTKKQQEMTQAS